ncbi:XdhC family protein [Curtobacterium albidum]|uniref:XdhC family protein n=1 Tax=Curtobacterium citreum TaxID=2036 RepID=UPI001AE6A426|nr:XdhC/CoxI family protein [Curtobacterium albidum]MCL9665859.1 XdhC family protein [Curtobacterium albidum]
MFELAPRLLAVLDTGAPVVVATAVSMTGSAPSGVGTSMAVLPGGQVVGTISGGCVEGSLFLTAERVAETGEPVLERFGFDDDPDDPDAVWAPALRCGGRVEVLVHRVTADDLPLVGALRDAAAGLPTSLALSLEPGTLGAVVTAPDGCRDRVFVERGDHRPRCIVVGAVETAVAVTNAAAVLGYAVTVVDPRPVFLTDERFPAADQRIVGWPTRVLEGLQVDGTTAVVVLAHDDRFDAEVIDQALRRGAGYVGAMGSRSTHERRTEVLRAMGTPDLDRLRSPIGLDIGARTPAEVALSIVAEVVAVRTGSSAGALTDGSGPIHRVPARVP